MKVVVLHHHWLLTFLLCKKDEIWKYSLATLEIKSCFVYFLLVSIHFSLMERLPGLLQIVQRGIHFDGESLYIKSWEFILKISKDDIQLITPNNDQACKTTFRAAMFDRISRYQESDHLYFWSNSQPGHILVDIVQYKDTTTIRIDAVNLSLATRGLTIPNTDLYTNILLDTASHFEKEKPSKWHLLNAVK